MFLQQQRPPQVGLGRWTLFLPWPCSHCDSRTARLQTPSSPRLQGLGVSCWASEFCVCRGGEQGALPFPTPGRPWRRRCSLQGRAQAGGQALSSHSLAASHWVAWGGAVAALRPGCCDSLLSFCRMDVAELMPADCLWWVAPWKFAD